MRKQPRLRQMLLRHRVRLRDKTLASGFYEGNSYKKIYSQIVVVFGGVKMSKSVRVFVTLESARERERR